MRLTESMRLRLTIIELLPKVSRGFAVALVCTTVMGAVMPVAFSVVTSRLIGWIPSALRDAQGSPAADRLFMFLALACILFVVQQAIGPFIEATSETLGRRVDGYLRSNVMEATLEPTGIAHLEDPKLHDQVSLARGVGPAQFTPGRAVQGLARISSQYLQALFFCVVLVGFKWWLGVLMFVVRVLLRQHARKNYLKMVNVFQRQAQSLRRSDYYRDLALRPEASKESRIFQMHDWILSRFTLHWMEVMKEAWSERKRGFGGMVPVMLINWALLSIAYWQVATEAIARRISLANVALYSMAIFSTRAMSWLTDADVQTEYGLVAVPAALRLHDVAEPSRLPSGTQDPKGRPNESVRLEGVSFSYPGSSVPVFEDLYLEIPAGKSLAIVGLNGAGKTTLVKLLCRFYDPDKGRITIDGHDIRDFDAGLWQQRVAAIFQDFVRYHLSARENVGFGAGATVPSFDDVRSAAQMAGAVDFIEELPLGWDSVLSRQYTDGADLSGGQWQRVALARAVLAARTNPGVLILDEPTANLDVRAEAEIYDRFLELTHGLTTVLISHRFSTVRRADKIVVLEHGRVVEEGDHDSLIVAKGRYSEMFRLQASRFLDLDEVSFEDVDD
ncbi:MAG: ABC transporter ATP-binding protein [Actinomycetota bacterium]